MTGTRAALFSFLRVLAVAEASAILPFITAPQSDEVPLRAVVTALIAAFLLTVVNYFRPGEQRFGPTDKPELDDVGRGTLGTIGVILAVIAAAAIVLHLLGVFLTSVGLAIAVLVIGVVLVLVDPQR